MATLAPGPKRHQCSPGSFWQPKRADLPGWDRQYLFHELRLARAMERLLACLLNGETTSGDPLRDQNDDVGGRYYRIVPADSGCATQIEALLKGTSESIGKLVDLVERGDGVRRALPEARRRFFDDQLLLPARLLLHAHRCLHAVTRAYGAADQDERTAALRTALEESQRMWHALANSAQGAFAGWYDGDRVFGIAPIQDQLRAALVSARRA